MIPGATKLPGTSNIVPTDAPVNPRDDLQGPGNCSAPKASYSAPGTGKGTWFAQ